MNYIYEYQIHFDECDPAGIMFFANTWDLCHRAYEAWLLSLKNDWSFWFENPQWIIPIISSKCDFKQPLKPGTRVQIEVSVQNIGNSSFSSHYQIKAQDMLVSDCLIHHVFTEKKTFKKIAFPEEVKDLMLPFWEKHSSEQ